ncbi:unnamed protein product [Caenorhabditis bovis]|uniref:Uncharacterized protein n=1 Tax=Caenorhabditis bovis TaxID=2654633 RepID=A0A8S1EL19_9PELO|nr:unnamed protein product [Caenorhabditis bovis]
MRIPSIVFLLAVAYLANASPRYNPEANEISRKHLGTFELNIRRGLGDMIYKFFNNHSALFSAFPPDRIFKMTLSTMNSFDNLLPILLFLVNLATCQYYYTYNGGLDPYPLYFGHQTGNSYGNSYLGSDLGGVYLFCNGIGCPGRG